MAGIPLSQSPAFQGMLTRAAAAEEAALAAAATAEQTLARVEQEAGEKLSEVDTAINTAVRTDTAAQPLTTQQRANARANTKTPALPAGWSGSDELSAPMISAAGGDPDARDSIGVIPAIYGTKADYYLANGSVNPTPTDDAAALQAAFNALKPGQTLRLNRYYFLNGKTVVLATKEVTIEGPGGLVGGTLAIGLTTGATVDYNIKISGVIFSGGATVTSGSATVNGLSIRLARRVQISGNCRFINSNKAIEVPAFAGEVFHGTGMLDIVGNQFFNVNYALYIDNNGLEAGGRPAWQHVNDSSFLGNYINRSYIGAIWIKGIDGFDCKDNIVFNVSYDDPSTTLKNLKDRCIYIGESDWVMIQDNKLFEPGLEAIHLDLPKNFNITGNHIAWPGQKAPASAIKLTGAMTYMSGIIAHNPLSQFTKHGIEVLVNPGGTDANSFSRLIIRDNRVEYLATTTKYYGSTPLNTIDHYAVFQQADSNCVIENSGDVLSGVTSNLIRNSPRSGLQFNNHARAEGFENMVAVTAADTPIALLTNRDPADTATCSALLHIIARQGTTQSGNAASYLLHVTKAPAGSALAQISAQGMTTGANLNWPSFTFTFDAATNQLRATPIANTSGTFYFYVTVIGSARLYKPA